MSPDTVRYIMQYDAPVGTLLLESDGTNLTALRFGSNTSAAAPGNGTGSSTSPVTNSTAASGNGTGSSTSSLPVFAETARWLDCYFSGTAPDFMPPIRTSGSRFQEAVWTVLRRIPYGTTTAYSQVARHVAALTGTRVPAQAVGGAVGKNPIAIVIPCHRVIGADGSLTGFAAGIAVKAALLRLEGIKIADSHGAIQKNSCIQT